MADTAGTPATGTAPDTTGATGTAAGAPDTTGTPAAEPAKAGDQQQTTPLTNEALEKLIQSRVDKGLAEERKKSAALQKEVDTLKKDSMTAEQVKEYELQKERDALATKEKEIAEKAKRITAITELTKLELYDGGENANALLNLVVNGANEEAEIPENVKALNSVINKLVAAKVDKTFKDNGRVPNGGGNGGTDTKQSSVAETLGKNKAEAEKKSNDILKHYGIGGNK